MGRAVETEDHILEAFHLSPRDVDAYRWMRFAGVAKLQLGSDAEAVSWLRRSTDANRNHPLAHLALAAALGLTGALDERTAATAGTCTQLRVHHPSLARCATRRQSDLPCWVERFCKGTCASPPCQRGDGPLRVKGAVLAISRVLPVYPNERTSSEPVAISQRCHF